MSDEEDESMSDGFSASEEEWQPGKDTKDGESSDDDDSDFEKNPKSKTSRSNSANILKKDSKLSGVLKQQSMVKKRKPAGQSLRARLYNKYRPPPKLFSPPNSGQNSPSASTSKGHSKNFQAPNEGNDDSDTDGSVVNYLVNPSNINLESSYYQNICANKSGVTENISVSVASKKNLSDTDSEDNNESSHEEHTARTGTTYDFQSLLDHVNSLENIKEQMLQKAISNHKTANKDIDVETLLALGENKDISPQKRTESKTHKTKSMSVKRHTKVRPTSTVADDDTDDSDFEEVPGRRRF